MTTQYWMFEYIKVLFGYLFLMFLCPSIIFHKHFQRKTIIYRFSFCIIIQIILVNIVVLGLGLFGFLNPKAVCIIFYGTITFILLNNCARIIKSFYHASSHFQEAKLHLLHDRINRIRTQLPGIWQRLRPRLAEYICLFILLIYGITYFSYTAFHHYSYGINEMYTSHLSIYGLLEGKITAEAGFQNAMQSFVYCMYALLL